jgi:hypothetical protein
VLAGHEQNCVGVIGASLQHLDCVDRGQNKQFDFVTSAALALYFLYHGQSTVGTAMTSWLHCQEIFSSIESGVWPNCSRNSLVTGFRRSST